MKLTAAQTKTLQAIRDKRDLPYRGATLLTVLAKLLDLRLITRDQSKLTPAGRKALGDEAPPPPPSRRKKVVKKEETQTEPPSGAEVVQVGSTIHGYMLPDDEFPAIKNLYVYVGSRAERIGHCSNTAIGRKRILAESQPLSVS
jgi:hypothetical protein